MPASPTVLFLCTGNYYRSRFAEALFNHVAGDRGSSWRAASRALAIEQTSTLPGSISPLVVEALLERGIDCDSSRGPRACTTDDLELASRIVALNRDEHRHLLASRFPGWEDRVDYWRVNDVGLCLPADALAEIERRVITLVDELARRSDDR